MTGIFRSNNPLNTFLLFVYGILLKFVWLIHPQIPVVEKSDGFLFKDLISAIKPFFDAHPTGYFFIAYLFLFTQALSFNQVIISRRLMQKPNFLPAMSYLLITSFFAEWNVLSAPMIINTFLIWIWSRMSNLNNNSHPKSTLYNIGIAIGVSAFFYLPAALFAVMVILAITIIRPVKIAEWIITFIGLLTPWYFLFCWLFFTNKLYTFRLSGFGISPKSHLSLSPELIAIPIILVMILAGSFHVRHFMIKQILQVRKSWALMLLFLVIAIAIPFIHLNRDPEYWLLALLPAAAFSACAFYYPRVKWVPMVVQWILVGFVLYLQYFQK